MRRATAQRGCVLCWMQAGCHGRAGARLCGSLAAVGGAAYACTGFQAGWRRGVRSGSPTLLPLLLPLACAAARRATRASACERVMRARSDHGGCTRRDLACCEGAGHGGLPGQHLDGGRADCRGRPGARVYGPIIASGGGADARTGLRARWRWGEHFGSRTLLPLLLTLASAAARVAPTGARERRVFKGGPRAANTSVDIQSGRRSPKLTDPST